MFAILGATERVGPSAIQSLRKAGAPVRAMLRDRSKAEDLEGVGCEIAVAGLHEKKLSRVRLQAPMPCRLSARSRRRARMRQPK